MARILLADDDLSTRQFLAAALQKAGHEVVSCEDGLAAWTAFEATPMAHVRKIFDTNTFGVMAMTQAVVPQMRERGSGVIVNVTSSATLAPMPLASAYTASKQAIEGFSEALAEELAFFGIRVKIVEPGYAPTTRFTDNSAINTLDLIPEAYQPFAGPIFAEFGNPKMTTRESDVARAIFAAANDISGQRHFPAGEDAVHLASIRQFGG